MEEEAEESMGRKPSRSSPPSWVILDRFIHRSNHDTDARRNCTTSSTSYTCTGRPIRASLRLIPATDDFFLAVSWLHLHWPDRPEHIGMPVEPHVIAAHDHAILFEAIVPFDDPNILLVYSAFSSPPAIHRLPACFVGGVSTPDEDLYLKPYRRRQQRTMVGQEIGLLCHGDGGGGEFTVVDFTNLGHDGELCLLHHHGIGSPEKKDIDTFTQWRVKKVKFLHHGDGPSVHYWITDSIVPVDGRFMCWVDNYQGILVLDVVHAIDDDIKGPVQLC